MAILPLVTVDNCILGDAPLGRWHLYSHGGSSVPPCFSSIVSSRGLHGVMCRTIIADVRRDREKERMKWKGPRSSVVDAVASDNERSLRERSPFNSSLPQPFFRERRLAGRRRSNGAWNHGVPRSPRIALARWFSTICHASFSSL